ncbi:hypothetical protein [Paracoccus laeviglucosivorans]|uniref:Uncharacterized protein n=1 Tax=Paracoccus laeviglucosivorans TaxID=1197861 RepID=A0A521DZM0_9RHOB|nr:hypothetical protein [Paracoccus laeviglucosivorans]SMO77072.1 hypothetical protein SAMN06265221_110115 [Paracoccus laeviglucosivorans]
MSHDANTNPPGVSPPAPPVRPERKWTPPLILAALAFLLGLFGDMADTTGRIAGWFRDPPLPKISEEYLMVELEPGIGIREGFERIAEQVQGVRMVQPAWLLHLDDQVMQATQVFCAGSAGSLAMGGEGDDPVPAETVAGWEAACRSDTRADVILGTYALRSFDPDPLTGLRIELALLDNDQKAIDAYDGFIDGSLSQDPPCFKSSISDECVADRVGTEMMDGLPVIGPGEQLILPIFASVRLVWDQAAIESAGIDAGETMYDGLAPTPFRFPARVYLGDRVLIENPRPMNATPSLRQGFYEGRG